MASTRWPSSLLVHGAAGRHGHGRRPYAGANPPHHGERIHAALEAGKIVVVAGFQGMTESGDITTLGRGGSDLTGVALAAALKADVCEIFTDVDGVYTADPTSCRRRGSSPACPTTRCSRWPPSAPRCSRRARSNSQRSSPCRCTSAPPSSGPGHLRDQGGSQHGRRGRHGITHDRGQAKLSILRVPDRPGIASQVFGGLAKEHIVVDMIVQNIGATAPRTSPSPARGDRQRRRRCWPQWPRTSAPPA